MIEKRTLWKSLVGSHLWKMNHDGSDFDYFTAYQMSTEDYLMGYRMPKGKMINYNDDSVKIDEASYEIGHIVKNLMNGNINFLWGIMSPFVEYTDEYGEIAHIELQDIVSRNLSKNYIGALRGITKHNLAHWFNVKLDGNYYIDIPVKLKTDLYSQKAQKKLKLIKRTLIFGTKLMYGTIEFKPVFGRVYLSDIKERIRELQIAYNDSGLPEEPDGLEYRNYLLKLRKRWLE